MITYINFLITIIVLLLICIIYITSTNIYDKLLNGFYEADSSFCEESGIDMFCIYFDGDISSNGSRACYILAKKDDEIIINEPTVAKITSQWGNDSDPTSVKYFNVLFEDIGEEIEEVFPKKQVIRFYPNLGKIVLFDENVITACLYKNGINSELKTLMEKN